MWYATHTDGTTYNPVSGLYIGDGACCPVAGTSCNRDGGGLQGSSPIIVGMIVGLQIGQVIQELVQHIQIIMNH